MARTAILQIPSAEWGKYGEPIVASQIPLICLVDRALFLRDAVVVAELRKTGADLDFWCAMETGIPEIQADALANMVQRDLSERGAVGNIDWNSQLVAELRKAVSSIKLSTFHPELDEWHLYGNIITRGKTITTRNEELEAMREKFVNSGSWQLTTPSEWDISIGYVYSWMKMAANATTENLENCKRGWEWAMSYARKELIDAFPEAVTHHMMISVSMRTFPCVGIGMVERAQSILEDPNTLRKITIYTRNFYKAICGHVKTTPDFAAAVEGLMVGIPFPAVRISGAWGHTGPVGPGQGMKYYTLHGKVFYSPRDCEKYPAYARYPYHFLISRAAYRLGYCFSVMPKDYETRILVNPEKRDEILARLLKFQKTGEVQDPDSQM